MVDLLYLSHTAVPAHLSELESLDLLERNEQVLMALDGVLLDGGGQRLSGPTLHDYCLLTSLRVLLWARDYGRHLCYAFPLHELCLVEGVGLDPLHAQLQLAFAGPAEEEQRFTLTLLPLADLPAAVTLLRLAAEAAKELLDQGIDTRDAGPEIAALLGACIFGTADGQRPPDTPYRWSEVEAYGSQSAPAPHPNFQHDPSALPPEQIYVASRMARSAWDTLRRSLRETDLPLELGTNGSLRDLADTLRAVNELLVTVANNPGAREMALAFLGRRGAKPGAASPPPPTASGEEAWRGDTPQATNSDYHEIPLRRRDKPVRSKPEVAPPPAEHSHIPLRRRNSEQH